MSNVQLTENELLVLTAIDESEYGDGLADHVWAFTIADNSPLRGKTISGTVSSLVKKNLVNCSGWGNDASIGINPEGIAAYKAAIAPKQPRKWSKE